MCYRANVESSRGPSPTMTLTPHLTRPPDDLVERFSRLRHGRDVAELLEVPYSVLVHILYWGRHKYPYRDFVIRKRSGRERLIEAPADSVDILQTKLLRILELVYKPRPAAQGFVQGRSIVSNALRHVGKSYVLNIDLKDFFPSIHFGRVRGLFMAQPYGVGAPASRFLAQLCCSQGKLPQGAPTSPIVSNMICSKLDGDLQKLAKKYRCTYTRYADDITFSTTAKEFPEDLASPVDAWTGPDLHLGPSLPTRSRRTASK